MSVSPTRSARVAVVDQPGVQSISDVKLDSLEQYREFHRADVVITTEGRVLKSRFGLD